MAESGQRPIIVPFYASNENAFMPKFASKTDNFYIYEILSPIRGLDIIRDQRVINSLLTIIIPTGLICYIKPIHLVEEHIHFQDYGYEKCKRKLTTGMELRILFDILPEMTTKLIMRGDVLGYLMFEQNIEFRQYYIEGIKKQLLKYERLSKNSFTPVKALDSAGYDLSSAIDVTILPGDVANIKTDIAFEIPFGCYGRIVGRSGISANCSIDVLAGVVDPGYRGNVFITLINHGSQPFVITKGDRIAQIIIEKYQNSLLVEGKLCKTFRGVSGYGSTGVESPDLNTELENFFNH